MRFLKAAITATAIVWAQNAAAFTFTFSTIEIGGDPSAFSSLSYGILVADTAGNGFEALTDSSLLINATTASSGTSLGADDVIILVTTADATGLNLVDFGDDRYVFTKGTTTFTTEDYSPAWDAGDSLGLFWFTTGTSQVGNPFNFYRSNGTGDGSFGFSTPGAGLTFSLINDSVAVNGSTPLGAYTTGYPNENPSQGGVSGTIAPIPEPSTVIFLVSVGLAFPFVRRFARLRKSP